jgi:hypothetical protein
MTDLASTTAPGAPARPAGRDGLRLAGWALVALAVALVRDRAWATPNLAFFSQIALHLGSNPFPKGLDGDYLLTNLSGPVLARALGQTAPHAYARLHLVVLVVGLGLAIVVVHRRFGSRAARAFAWILAVSPAVTVCLEWLGQPDALTLPLALGITLARRRRVGFGLAVLLGLTHPEQGLVAAVIATLTLSFCGSILGDGPRDRPRERGVGSGAWWRELGLRGAALVGGVAVGRGITELYLRADDIVVSRPRTSYLCLGVRGFWDFHTQSPAALVYALWGPLWLLWAWLGWRWWRSRRGPWPALVALAVLALIPVAVTLDETRVHAMITAPLLVALAVLASREPLPRWASASRPRRAGAAVALVVLAAAVPGGFTAGQAYWAPALRPAQFARFLADGHVPGGADQLSPWLLSPFGFHVPPRC